MSYTQHRLRLIGVIMYRWNDLRFHHKLNVVTLPNAFGDQRTIYFFPHEPIAVPRTFTNAKIVNETTHVHFDYHHIRTRWRPKPSVLKRLQYEWAKQFLNTFTDGATGVPHTCLLHVDDASPSNNVLPVDPETPPAVIQAIRRQCLGIEPDTPASPSASPDPHDVDLVAANSGWTRDQVLAFLAHTEPHVNATLLPPSPPVAPGARVDEPPAPLPRFESVVVPSCPTARVGNRSEHASVGTELPPAPLPRLESVVVRADRSAALGSGGAARVLQFDEE